MKLVAVIGLSLVINSNIVLSSVFGPSARGANHAPNRPTISPYPAHPGKLHLVSPPRNRTCVVPSLGNNTDHAQAILEAAKKCNHGGRVLFSEDVTYGVGTALDLRFLDAVDLEIQGTIKFTPNIPYWSTSAFPLQFQNATAFWLIGGTDVNIYGGGTLHGNGQVWYDAYAKDIYILRPILLGIVGMHGGSVSEIKMRYSPQWFNIVVNSTDVVFDGIDIAGGSVSKNVAKNTDGWDTYRSDSITIQNSIIDNGDDCVSFKPNSTNIVVQNLTCHGSHGISVGSLGQYPGTYDIVTNISVFNIHMSDASDGARIKVWPGANAELSGDLQGGGGEGRVENVTYDGMFLKNVDSAVVVTQCYGQRNKTLCEMFPSNVTISNISFRNIQGTTSKKYDPKAGSIICSSPTVCNDIHAENISVTNPSKREAWFECDNVDESFLDINCQ